MAGRPTVYTDEIGREICDRLAEGETLTRICDKEGMPARSTVINWAYNKEHPIFEQYARARELGYKRMAEEIVDISDDDSKDTADNPQSVARARLRVDTRKWLMSKALPKIYGDKLTTHHVGKDEDSPIEVQDTDFARRVAFILSQNAS